MTRTSRDVCAFRSYCPEPIFCRGETLQPRLDGAEQPKPHLGVIACERDHETRPAMAGGVGITRIPPAPFSYGVCAMLASNLHGIDGGIADCLTKMV